MKNTNQNAVRGSAG
jgi:hypothetical protein